MRVGIDLGTTYSLVARMDAEGRPALVPDHAESDVFHTPSVVHLAPQNAAFVGRMAEQLLEQDPTIQVIRFFKRLMGVPEPVCYDDNGAAWYPEGITALLLKKLAFDVETMAHQPLSDAVITVPAHFNDPQRKAVLASATLADVEVLGLVEEPVAAALHYGVVGGVHDQVLLVYDFGGGTFDATAMSMDARGVYVLAKTGLTELGGKEIDEKVGAMILTQFERAMGQPMPMGARTLLELRRISEEVKIELCLPGKNRVRKMAMLGGQAVEIEIARSEFDAAIKDFLDRTDAEMMACLREAGLRSEDVGSLLLVGGSSLVPLVEDRLRTIFHRPGQQVLHHEPSKAVAYGAAIHASQLAGDAALYNIPPELRGVSGYSVGIRTFDPSTGHVGIDTLIKKNMQLPARLSKTYYTTRPNQERLVLDFVQFRDQREGSVSLGQLVIGPLNAPRPNYAVEVTTHYREDGTVAVQAYDAQTGVELEQVFGRQGEDSAGHLASQRSLVRNTVINGLIA